ESDLVAILLPLVAGYILDCLFGDPRWSWHPVRIFGNMISLSEKLLNKGSFRFIKGAVFSLFLCLFIFFLFFITGTFLFNHHTYLYYLFASIFVFFGLANKSL